MADMTQLVPCTLVLYQCARLLVGALPPNRHGGSREHTGDTTSCPCVCVCVCSFSHQLKKPFRVAVARLLLRGHTVRQPGRETERLGCGMKLWPASPVRKYWPVPAARLFAMPAPLVFPVHTC